MKLRAFKYRFYPTAEQEHLLRRTIGCARLVYNKALFLPARQHYRGFVVPNARFVFVPSLGPQGECFVVDKPRTADRSPQQVFLFSRWIESVLERPKFHCHILAWFA